jgi:hypothetical protein
LLRLAAVQRKCRGTIIERNIGKSSAALSNINHHGLLQGFLSFPNSRQLRAKTIPLQSVCGPLVGNAGIEWMYSTASAWFMTTLNSDPLMVSLVQVALSLLMFIFAASRRACRYC